MKRIFPKRLEKGDEIRVIAPARSLSIISQESRDIASKRFAELGLTVTFGAHIEESDIFDSSTVESRIADLYDAFADTNVKGILTVIGGYNSNQLLDYIDWELIRKSPKVFCGYSDITALANAIFAKTGLVTYYGPHYSSFGEKKNFDYTLEYFKQCMMTDDLVQVVPSKVWSNDPWYREQDKRSFFENEGWWTIQTGKAQGTILGGNLCTFNLLQGTKYFPAFMENTILFLEDDGLVGVESDVEFDRNLQSIIHQPGFEKVVGIAIGRFEIGSEISAEKLTKIIKSKKELARMPVVANIDFGHTTPMITFPIGGSAVLDAQYSSISFLPAREG